MIHEQSSDTNAGSTGSGYHSHLIGEVYTLAGRAQGRSSRIDVDTFARPALAASRPLSKSAAPSDGIALLPASSSSSRSTSAQVMSSGMPLA